MKKFGSMLLMTLCLTMALSSAAFAAETVQAGVVSVSNVVDVDYETYSDGIPIYICDGDTTTITITEDIGWFNAYYWNEYYQEWTYLYFDNTYDGTPIFDTNDIYVTAPEDDRHYSLTSMQEYINSGYFTGTEGFVIPAGTSITITLPGYDISLAIYDTEYYLLQYCDIYFDTNYVATETTETEVVETETTETEVVDTETTEIAEEATATPTPSTIYVNGEVVAFDAYTINDNNYFKLRDLAYILSGTEVGFEVTWDQALGTINLESNAVYTEVSGEMAQGDGTNQTATLNTSLIYMDGELADLAAYTINDNNYFKLRDLGELFDFNVSWDGDTNSIIINTSEAYTAD